MTVGLGIPQRTRSSKRIWNRSVKVLSSVPFLTITGSLVFALFLLSGGFHYLQGMLLMLVVIGAYYAITEHEERGRLVSGLRGLRLELDGRILKQVHEDGLVLSEIDLDRPFEVSVPYSGSGVGIVRVTQDEEILDFSSDTPGSEAIACEHLGFRQWPPDAAWNAPW